MKTAQFIGLAYLGHPMIDVNFDREPRVTKEGTAYCRVDSEWCCFRVSLVRDGVIVDEWDTQNEDWENRPVGHKSWESRQDPDDLKVFWDWVEMKNLVEDEKLYNAQEGA